MSLIGPMDGPGIVWKAGSELWVPFSPADPTIASCPFKEWLRPIKYNQGGFDAVYMTEEGAVECEEGERFKTVSVLFVQYRSVIIEYKHTQRTGDIEALAYAALDQIMASLYTHSIPSNHDLLMIGCAIGEFNPRRVSFQCRQV